MQGFAFTSSLLAGSLINDLVAAISSGLTPRMILEPVLATDAVLVTVSEDATAVLWVLN